MYENGFVIYYNVCSVCLLYFSVKFMIWFFFDVLLFYCLVNFCYIKYFGGVFVYSG